MKNSTIKEQLFAPTLVEQGEVSESDYQGLDAIKVLCDTFSRIYNQSIYIIDYAKQGFWYVSPHLLFLSGYTREEVESMGYDFYEKVVPPKDLAMLLEINKMGWGFFENASKEDKLNFCISYDFHLIHKNGTKILVNQKLSSVRLTKTGKIWLAVCVVGYSAQKKSGNVVFKQGSVSRYYTYNFQEKEIVQCFPDKLSMREKQIFDLIMQGYSTYRIADMLGVSESLVRTNRRNIEKKLGINNLPELIAMFNSIF